MAIQSRPLCGQITLALGEVLWRKQTEATSQDLARSSQYPGKELTNETARVREYLTRAADLCGTLGMNADLERARALLAQLE